MNVQQTIIKGIQEQLFYNDYLVLPDFGGFVLRKKNSHFSSTGGSIIPPSKTVSFNVQLKQNDGILAIWLQNKLACTSSEALSHLMDFSQFCSGILNTKRRLTLDGIGFFYLDFENNICFEPLGDMNFSAESFGLTQLSVKPLEQVAEEPKKENVFVDRAYVESEAQKTAVKIPKNYRRMINTGLISLGFITLLALLVSNSYISGTLRSAITGSKPGGIYSAIAYPDLKITASANKLTPYVADANGIATLELESEKTIAVKAVEIVSHATHHSRNYRKKRNYEIVLGCFTLLENAKKLTRKLSAKNIHAYISGKNAKGMYVVSNGDFTTKEEAVSKLSEVKQENQNAWIRKME